MEQNIYYLPIETSNGLVKLKVELKIVSENDEEMEFILLAMIQGKKYSYQAETTEDALILLAKSLPEKWHIKSCLSCRYGHFCPVGNNDNELFCVTDFEPKSPRDLWEVTENNNEREKRSRMLFDSCEYYKEQSKDYYTYNDYYFKMNEDKESDR